MLVVHCFPRKFNCVVIYSPIICSVILYVFVAASKVVVTLLSLDSIYFVGFTTALNRTFPLATLSYALLISSNGDISVITFTLPFAT